MWMHERPPETWDEAFVLDSLHDTVWVPGLVSATLVGTTRAACVFEHPDGTHVPLNMPLSSILYVPQYRPITAQLRKALSAS